MTALMHNHLCLNAEHWFKALPTKNQKPGETENTKLEFHRKVLPTSTALPLANMTKQNKFSL